MMANIEYLKFGNLPSSHPSAGAWLKRNFGYEPKIVDNCWAIHRSDAGSGAGNDPLVRMHAGVLLEPGKFAAAAEQMLGAVDEEKEALRAKATAHLPKNASVPGGFGEISELQRLSTMAVLLPKAQLGHFLANEYLPHFFTEHQAQYAVPVTVNANRQQAHFSFAKIAVLAEKFGITEAQRRVQELDALEGAAMTGATELLDFVDALTRVFPILFTLPLRRDWCAWHFVGPGFRSLTNIGFFKSFYNCFVPSANARTWDWSYPDLVRGLGPMGEPNIWRLLRHACKGVHSLMTWANDHRNFADPAGLIDLRWQLQVYATMKFLLADLISIHESPGGYLQSTFAFGFLDKLANLKALSLRLPIGSDTAIFSELLSRDYGRFLAALLKRELSATHPELAASLVTFSEQVYDRLHAHVADELDTDKRSEANIVQRLRSLRNLNHGAYLNRDQFSELYFGSKGTVPASIASLPFLLTLGLVSCPREFLHYRASAPQTSTN